MPGRVTPIRTPRLELVAVDRQVIRALLDADRTEAERMLGMRLPRELPNGDERHGFLGV